MITRRTFSAALLSVPALAAEQEPAPPMQLPPGQSSGGGDAFAFPGSPNPRTRWNIPGLPRKYFAEWLPALFERTIEIDDWQGPKSQLQWIFTGLAGGFTVEAAPGKVRLAVRYYDSPGLTKRPGRHPESIWEESAVDYSGDLKAITVIADHKLTIRILLNGKEALTSKTPLDVNRHQAAFNLDPDAAGGLRARLLTPAVNQATVTVDDTVRHQQMLGWGGTTPAPAFHELNPRGAEQWWKIIADYNLLLHREYPTGAMLNPEMTNWDRPESASPHYYGDNFPNCETTDFDYIRRIRSIGGQVVFEFWELPPWARRKDSSGKLTEAPEIEAYVKAMVRYCEISRDRVGHPPEIVGIQNEVTQSAEDWHKMALALREGLDRAGFRAVKIHMHNAATLAAGITAAKAFREDPAVWKTIDYAASNVYDYQSSFYDPDAYDQRLGQMREATASKPFFSVEVCVNSAPFQSRAYRIAFAMGQLYHKLLTQLDACGIMYCWLLLNVVEPSYGWTRSLLVPDHEHDTQPIASSHQLRVFGAWSRHILAGMTRVKAESTEPNLLVTAFQGTNGAKTVVLMNRATKAQKVTLNWPGTKFALKETASPGEENQPLANAEGEILIAPGSIVTLSRAAAS